MFCMLAQPVRAGMSSLSLTEADFERLNKGETIVRTLAAAKGCREHVGAAIMVPARPETVWRVLLDYEHAPEFIPGMVSSRVLQTQPGYDVIEQTVDLLVLLPRITYVVRSDYIENRRMSFKQIKGDLSEIRGVWNLLPQSNQEHTLLKYSLYCDPGIFVPQWIVNSLLEDDLPALMKAIRDRAVNRNSTPRQTPPQKP